jgi:hypothetical protein
VGILGITAGDPALDAIAHVESRSPVGDVQRALAAPSARERVRALLAEADTVELDPEGISVVVPGKGDVAGFEQAAAALAAIAGAMPTFTPGRAAKPRSQVLLNVSIVIAGLAFPIVLGLGGEAPLDASAPRVGFGIGGVLWLALMMLATAALKGHADALRRLIKLGVATLFFVPVATCSALIQANHRLDASPGSAHATTVTHAWASRMRSGREEHYVDLASWRKGQERITLPVSSSFAAKVRDGSGVVVTTHRGKLGWEWVAGIRAGAR